MLGVVIANGDKQLVIDLPTSSAAMQAELASIDITVPAKSILLSNEEGAQIRIKLYASTPSSAHFREKIAKLSYVPKRGWFQIAGDFQCDQTRGFPTNLVVNWAKGKAWLELDRSKARVGQDLNPYELGCVEWGIRECHTLQDYTSLTMSLGKAVAHAIELDEEIYEEMMMEW